MAEFLARLGVPAHPFPNFEPHVAARVIDAMLAEAGPSVQLMLSVGELTAAPTAGGRIISLTTASGVTVSASQFLDCSYEGDLIQAALPQSGWTVGREARTWYNESMAGAEGAPWAANRYDAGISPWVDGTNTTLLPTVSLAPHEAPGDGDARVQSYNYRVCLTNDTLLRVPIAPPAGYTPASVELLRRWWVAEAAAGRADGYTIGDLFLLRYLPCAACTTPRAVKLDVNDGAMSFGMDMPFLQEGYPTANATRRQAIAQEHEWWTRALFTFLASDDSGAVPHRLQASFKDFGLCGDDWASTAHWPPQLYAREGARLVGDVVLTQADVLGAKTSQSESSVGLSRWLVDIHAVQRLAVPNGSSWLVVDAGDLNTAKQPWQLTAVPFHALLPSAGTADNLAAPTAPSASHIAYATYRLEPQYGVFGHSAAVAAVLALRSGNAPLHSLDIQKLQAELLAQGQLLNATGAPATQAITLAGCDAADWRQNWTFSHADGTLRLAGGVGDPSSVVPSAAALAQLDARTPWSSLTNEARFLLRGGGRGGLSGVCASIYAYSTAPGAPVWAAACHTADKDPAHANQEYDVLPVSNPAGTVQLRARISGLCLAASASTDEGAAMEQQPCTAAGTKWLAPASAPAGGLLQLVQTPGSSSLCAAGPGFSMKLPPLLAS